MNRPGYYAFTAIAAVVFAIIMAAAILLWVEDGIYLVVAGVCLLVVLTLNSRR